MSLHVKVCDNFDNNYISIGYPRRCRTGEQRTTNQKVKCDVTIKRTTILLAHFDIFSFLPFFLKIIFLLPNLIYFFCNNKIYSTIMKYKLK